MTDLRLACSLTPHGRLVLTASLDSPELVASLAARLEQAFSRGSGWGLLRLGFAELDAVLPPDLAFWRAFGARYATALCTQAGRDDTAELASDLEAPAAAAPAARTPISTGSVTVSAPLPEQLAALARAAPPMIGVEYLNADVLADLWRELQAAINAELCSTRLTVPKWLEELNPAWNLVGRVHFNVAENRHDPEVPFAFLATYTTKLATRSKAQHVPLGQALREYAGAANKAQLLNLLVPVQRAAARCEWLRVMVEAGEIFHPLRWTPQQTMALLTDVPALEQAGVVVRLPAAWKAGRPPRPSVTATVGQKSPAVLGSDALLDFRAEVTLDGETLTQDELRQLLAGSDGLALLRGQWVEVDREHLSRVLSHYRDVETLAARGGVSFSDALRMLAGADLANAQPDASNAEQSAEPAGSAWSRVVAGAWLDDTLRGLRSPDRLALLDPGADLQGQLRPYQRVGVQWLYALSKLGLGACLADDMGLGKTIQVLALLVVERRNTAATRRPSLLVAPASLLANWSQEIERFAPSLTTLVAHPSVLSPEQLEAPSSESLAKVDLVITSYGCLSRIPWLASTAWGLVILDEAQAIKNPDTRQTRAVKALKSRARIALTGTPVENRLADLWSIFDFINPGLLGSARQFTQYTKRLTEAARQVAPVSSTPTTNVYGPLRELVRPYILRRLKTDRAVIADLPDKTEVKAYCQLSRKQVALYAQAVDELAKQLALTDGARRRAAVLTTLMRMKQICNHPSLWLSDGSWAEGDSGKWTRLREIAEVIADKQEKVLVFTQFRELTAPLSNYLHEVFGRPGLVLHGQTAVKKRQDLVARFQDDESVPFFVLSLRAGGTGLNLTAASHVVHFDRWWNPAVENQATDRAFRIGQKHNVLVHKFICRGTVEDKIDALIESKRSLTAELLEGGADVSLTELGNDELLSLLRLDLNNALAE